MCKYDVIFPQEKNIIYTYYMGKTDTYLGNSFQYDVIILKKHNIKHYFPVWCHNLMYYHNLSPLSKHNYAYNCHQISKNNIEALNSLSTSPGHQYPNNFWTLIVYFILRGSVKMMTLFLYSSNISTMDIIII